MDADRGALPYALIHGEALVVCAAWALGAAGVVPIDAGVDWEVLVESREPVVVHDALCPLTPPAFIAGLVRECLDTGEVLLLTVDVEVAYHHDAAVGTDLVLAAAELARRHIALHDVDAVLLVEGDARYLIEADNVVLADETTLSSGIVDEHLCDRRLAAGDQMRVGRDLLKQVALAGSARTEFNEVVVALDKRNHAKQRHTFGPFVQATGLEAHRSKQDVDPLGRREGPSSARCGGDRRNNRKAPRQGARR